MKKFNRFGHVYRLIQKKHPDWSRDHLVRCTLYAVRRR